MQMEAIRSPWLITVHVWHALFMREAMARITADRVSWLWILTEPVAHILLLVWVRTLIGRARIIPGAEFIPWLVVGITSFILFRNQMNRCMEAINANKALFAYRQVLPVDTVLVRSALEGVLSTIVLVLLVSVFGLLEYELFAYEPLEAMGLWLLLGLLGLGMGLILSVLVTIVPESARFIRMASFPLYFLSGVMIPVQYLPYELREYLLYNPLLHGIELIRSSFFMGYRAVDGANSLYLLQWVSGTLFIGLLLQVRFKHRLLAQ